MRSVCIHVHYEAAVGSLGPQAGFQLVHKTNHCVIVHPSLRLNDKNEWRRQDGTHSTSRVDRHQEFRHNQELRQVWLQFGIVSDTRQVGQVRALSTLGHIAAQTSGSTLSSTRLHGHISSLLILIIMNTCLVNINANNFSTTARTSSMQEVAQSPKRGCLPTMQR